MQRLYNSMNYIVRAAIQNGSCELHIEFYTFNVEYVFLYLSITKLQTKLELEKQLVLYYLS